VHRRTSFRPHALRQPHPHQHVRRTRRQWHFRAEGPSGAGTETRGDEGGV
jgi:hypothetical protein